MKRTCRIGELLITDSSDEPKLYLRYDAELHGHYRNCLKDLRDLQAQRLPPDDAPNEPRPPIAETETASADEPQVSVSKPEPDEPTLTPEQARLAYIQSEIQRFEDYQAQVFRALSPQTAPVLAQQNPDRQGEDLTDLP